MQPSNFDELTKALASSTSRRDALRTIVTMSVGGLFGLGGIRSIFASNTNCAHFCAAVFGPDTRAAGSCTSDGAHGRGLCAQCGSANPSSICCVRNSRGYCSGSFAVQCPCKSNLCLTCDSTHGACVGCPSGQTCLNGECCANANVCGSTCLAAPCDASQCLHCDSGSGACVGCPAGQTCQSGTCCIPAFTGPCTSDDQCCDFPNSTCCSGICCHGPAICLEGSCIDNG